jgi:alkylhydroperoxidase family enzyme
MARLPYLDRSDLLPEHQDLLARNLNLYRELAHSPRAARSLNTLARYIRDGSRLDPRLRELAILQVAYLTRSAWGSRITSGSGARLGFGRRDPRHCR